MWLKYTKSKRNYIPKYIDVNDILNCKRLEKVIGKRKLEMERSILFGI